MKKIIYIIIAMLLLSACAVIVVVALTHQKKSADMAFAIAALRDGKDDVAKDKLVKIISQDRANENAYVLLAQIYGRQSLYLYAASCWQFAARLNPLNKEYEDNFWKSAIAGKADDFIISKFSSGVADKFSDKYCYEAAMAFLRKSDTLRCAEILKHLRTRKSMFADLLEANMSIDRGNISSAKAFYKNVSGRDDYIGDVAKFGLAVCAFEEGNPSAAKALLEDVKSVEMKSYVLTLKSKIAGIEGDSKKSFEYLNSAYELERTNLQILLECANLAYALSNPDVIAGYAENVNPQSKVALELKYYLRSLELAARGNYKEASDNFRLCGNFKNSDFARVFALKLACLSNDAKAAAESAASLPKNISEPLRAAIGEDLKKLFAANVRTGSPSAELAEQILNFDDKNKTALRATTLAALKRGDFATARRLGETLANIDSTDRFACEAQIISLENLHKFDEGLKLAKSLADSKNADMFSLIYAAKFSAGLGDANAAVKYYMGAAAFPSENVNIYFEIGDFVAKHGKYEDSTRLVELVRSNGSGHSESVAHILSAQIQMKLGNYAGAIAAAESALKADDALEVAHITLAMAQTLDNNIESAEKTMRDFLARGGSSEYFKTMFASLLLDKNTRSSAEEVVKLMEKPATDSRPSARRYLLLSSAYSMLGDKEKSLQAAKSAREIAPDNREVLSSLARRMYERMQYADSLDLFLSIADSDSAVALEKDIENALSKASAAASSASSRKIMAQSVLKKFPNSAVAKDIKKKAVSEIESKN